MSRQSQSASERARVRDETLCVKTNKRTGETTSQRIHDTLKERLKSLSLDVHAMYMGGLPAYTLGSEGGRETVKSMV